MGNFTKTFYIPSGNGWTSGNYYCRFKVVQAYTSSTNKSTFKVTPQFKCSSGSAGGSVTGGTISVNGTTLKNFSGSSYYRANFFSSVNQFTDADGWADLTTTDPNQPTSWTSGAISHSKDGTASVTFACSSLVASGVATFNGSAVGGLAGDARTYTLTISAGTGASVTVKRGSSTLSNGATVTFGDALTVTAGAQSGYRLSTFTINGTAKTSPAKVTVTGSVSVAVTAEAQGLASLYVGGAYAEYSPYIHTSGVYEQYQPFVYTSGSWQQY